MVKKFFKLFSIISMAFLASPLLAKAQDLSVGLEVAGSTGLGTTDPKVAILNIIRIALGFLGLIAVAIILVGGFKWMTAAGAEEKIKQARKYIINGIIGLVIILAAFLIVTFVVNQIGGQLGTGNTISDNGGNGGGGGGGGGGGTGDNVFRVTNIVPSNNSVWSNRDVIVVVNFTFPVDANSLSRAISINQLKVFYQDPVTQSFNLEVPGAWTVASGASLNFTPQDNCPAPNGAYHCFKADSRIEVQILGQTTDFGLRSGNGLALRCTAADSYCSSIFTVGNQVFGPAGVNQPMIDSIDPVDGAGSTWVTLSGRNFGNTTGTVQLIKNGAVAATVTIPMLPGCQNQWGNQEVMVEMPANINLSEYFVKLNTVADKASNQVPFTVNTVTRPGLCAVAPGTAQPETTLTLKGKNLQSGTISKTAVFGSDSASQTAPVLNYAGGALETVTVNVPNLAKGQTSIKYSLGGVDSNSRSLQIIGGPTEQLLVRYINPTSTTAGGYVTIFGQGFGGSKTTARKVEFSTDNGGWAEAGYDFPAVCSSDFWQNDQIIVKVPVAAANTPSAIRVSADGQQVTTNADNYFQRNEGIAAPGICSLRPSEARAGDLINLAGDNFTAGQQTYVVWPSTTSIPFQQLLTRGIASTTNQSLSLFVPEGAATGQLTVKTVVGAVSATSNKVNFKLKTQGSSGTNGLGGYFDWNFKTCNGCTYPEVVESLTCAADLASPSPKANSQDVPIDLSDLSVNFNTVIQQPLVRLTVGILWSCNQGSQFSFNDCVAVNWNKVVTVIAGTNTSTLQIHFSNPAWQANTWYQLTINKDRIKSASDGHWPMQEDYSWHFRIGSPNVQCRLSAAQVLPRSYRARLGESKAFTAIGTDVNCNECAGQFSWPALNDSRATLTASTPTSSSATVLAVALATSSPVAVRAVVYNQPNISSTASLFIVATTTDATNFYLVNPYPEFSPVCRNAFLGARFSLPVSNQIDNLNKLQVFVSTISTSTISVPVAYNVSAQFSRQLLFGSTTIALVNSSDPQQLLEANKTYRVFVPKNIASSLDVNLQTSADCGSQATANFSTTGDFLGCSFSLDTTQDVCRITSVAIEPVTSTLAIGNVAEFSGVAYGQLPGGTGSATNTIQLPLISPFNWTLQNGRIATITPGAVRINTNPVSITALAEGGTILQAKPAVTYQVSLPIGQASIKVQGVSTQPYVYQVDPGQNATNVCRNRLVSLTFDQVVNPLTVTNQTIRLEVNNSLAATGSWWQKIYHSLIGDQAEASPAPGVSGQLPPASGNGWQSVAAEVTSIETQAQIGSQNRRVTKVLITPTQALPATARVRVLVLGGQSGVLSQNNQPLLLTSGPLVRLNNTSNWLKSDFQTRADICALDHLTIDPAYHLFTTSAGVNASYNFVAQANSVDNQTITSIDGLYSWNWTWDSSKQDVVTVSPNGFSSLVTAQNHNGVSDITATASTTLGSPQAKKSVVAEAEVDLCENPWPSQNSAGTNPVFQDIAYNFSLHYCRDAGVAHNPVDDLPNLTLDGINALPVYDPTPRPNASGLLREYIIPVPGTSDIIGLRVYQNQNHLSPIDWYRTLNKPLGAPQSAQVDDYPAIKDGSSVYVGATDVGRMSLSDLIGRQPIITLNNSTEVLPWWKKILVKLGLMAEVNAAAANSAPAMNSQLVPAANLINQDNLPSSNIYTNIYLLSYNQGASVQTMEIVKRLLANWRFNLNLTNRTELKAEIIRDWQRIRDFSYLNKALDSYQKANGYYPKLVSGSYQAGQSVSTWPSWAGALTTEIGQSLPTDPFNIMNIDDPQNATAACAGPTSNVTANAGFEPRTCWNNATHQFACTNKAYIYAYQATNNGANYNLFGHFETTLNWPNTDWLGDNNKVSLGRAPICQN